MELPRIPDDDTDFTPDLARKIIEEYRRLLLKQAQENRLLQSQFRNCHLEIKNLRDALLMAGVERS